MKKSRLFAPFLMLLAGAVASITMAGCFIQKKVLAFMNQIRENEEALEREAAAEREEVIEGEKQEVEEREEEDEE